MMRPVITEEPIKDRILVNHNIYPDSVEIGKAGSRLKIYFNADDLETALRRCDEALLVREYAVNGLLKQIEKDILDKAKK
jgi:CBS-domain-containing membrane protein